MNTIEEIFSHNCRKFRGNRTQAKMAELAELPFRTYQNCEAGVIPQVETRKALVKAFGLKNELPLFDLPEAPGISVQDALSVLQGFVENQLKTARIPAELSQEIAELNTEEMETLRSTLRSIRATREVPAASKKSRAR